MDSRVLAAAEKAQPGREVSIHESVARLSRLRRTLAVGVSVAAALSLSASGALSAFAQDVSQSNSNGATTTVSDAASSLLGLTGPIVIPITVGTGLNLNGPTNVNVASSQDESGNATNNKVTQSNSNQANTHVSDPGTSVVKGVGPVVVPITVGTGVNVNGPTNVNIASSQDHSGNSSNNDISQSNSNSSTTTVTDDPLVGILGPVVVPITIGTGLNLNGPTNINVASSQDESGNQINGKVRQSNSNSSHTVVDDPAAVKVAGPVVVPVTVGTGVNVNGPTNVNVASSQDESGNAWGMMVWQSNHNSSMTSVSDTSDPLVTVLGPVVAPVTVGTGVNVNGPTNVNVASSQDHSGNAWNSSVWQSNHNSSTTTVHDSRDPLVSVLGPVVVPVTVGTGVNVNGPTNVNVASSQDESGNASSNQVWQSNSNSSTTVVTDEGGVLDGLLGLQEGVRLVGPVVVPVTVGTGININCPTNINVASSQDESGNCSSPPAKMKMKSTPPPNVTTVAGNTAMVAATEMTPAFPATGFLATGAGKTLAGLGFLVLAAIGAAGALALRRFRPLS